MAQAPGPDLDRWEADVVTADGGTVHVRPIRPDDADRIVAFHSRQSAESIYFRFFSPRPRLSPAEIEHFTHVDGRDRMAFVALLGDELVGVARYDRLAGRADAEVAFFVDEEHKGRGVATILLEYLAAAARDAGIAAFVAVVLPNNRRMIGVFRQAGFVTSSRFDEGVVEVNLDLSPTAEALAAMEQRARMAETRSVARLLEPASIAVIGAGREPGGIGHEVFRQLLAHRFAGTVHPVNARAHQVAGVPAYASILDVPDRVDLAVIAVPADEVRGVVEQCALARVGGLVVMSGGFGEIDEAGGDAERELVALARRNGMRIIGPNSMGIINTDPAVRMHATFAPLDADPGGVALNAQSGALAAAVVERAHRLGLGISTMVSAGNKADVSGNDLLRYWASDERTRVVMLYLESFGNPRRFSRLVRDVSREKPVVAVTRAPAPTTDALLAQTGVIRVDTLEEMLGVARVLVAQPVPRGSRVVVLGNAGGPTTLAADACGASGLELARPEPATIDELRALAPAGGRLGNPVELTHTASGDDYERALTALLRDEHVDVALVVYAPPTRFDVEAVGHALLAASAVVPDKTIVASLFAPGSQLVVAEGDRSVPNFLFADAAARALGKAAGYGRWRLRRDGSAPTPTGTDIDVARTVVDDALAASPGGASLSLEDAWRVVRAAGIALVEQRLVRSADDAAAAARELGLPVALKATGLAHFPKSEAGGLALDLQDEDDVRRAYDRMHARLGTHMVPAVVQRMAVPGVDLRARVFSDPLVGAAIGLGPGGAGGEAVPDEAVQVVPLTDVTAIELARGSATAAAVEGDGTSALQDLLLRLSWLADEVPAIAEMALDPLMVGDHGAVVLDVAVRVAPWRVEQEPPVRRL